MKITCSRACSIVGLIAAAGWAGADVTYTAQTREVWASIYGGGVSEEYSSPDFERFVRTARVDDPFVTECSAMAFQHSALLSDGITVVSEIADVDGRQSSGGISESVFTVAFELSEATAYEFTGDWGLAGITFGGWAYGFATIRLSDDDGTVFESEYTPGPTAEYSDEFGLSGVLPAGRYQLFARLYGRDVRPSTGTTGISGDLMVSLQFSELCAADLNQDGIVDFSDYLEFLNLFDAGDLRVDYTGDGIVDFSDYLEFLNLFEAGC